MSARSLGPLDVLCLFIFPQACVLSTVNEWAVVNRYTGACGKPQACHSYHGHAKERVLKDRSEKKAGGVTTVGFQLQV